MLKRSFLLKSSDDFLLSGQRRLCKNLVHFKEQSLIVNVLSVSGKNHDFVDLNKS